MGKGQGVLISVLRCLLCALAYWLPSVAAESASTVSNQTLLGLNALGSWAFAH